MERLTKKLGKVIGIWINIIYTQKQNKLKRTQWLMKLKYKYYIFLSNGVSKRIFQIQLHKI
jgi:hypothetical protein